MTSKVGGSRQSAVGSLLLLAVGCWMPMTSAIHSSLGSGIPPLYLNRTDKRGCRLWNSTWVTRKENRSLALLLAVIHEKRSFTKMMSQAKIMTFLLAVLPLQASSSQAFSPSLPVSPSFSWIIQGSSPTKPVGAIERARRAAVPPWLHHLRGGGKPATSPTKLRSSSQDAPWLHWIRAPPCSS